MVQGLAGNPNHQKEIGVPGQTLVDEGPYMGILCLGNNYLFSLIAFAQTGLGSRAYNSGLRISGLGFRAGLKI